MIIVESFIKEFVKTNRILSVTYSKTLVVEQVNDSLLFPYAVDVLDALCGAPLAIDSLGSECVVKLLINSAQRIIPQAFA